MASKKQQDVVKIVVPIDKQTETTESNQATNLGKATLRTPIEIGTHIASAWAPAWFYSALSWLGQSYYDASNTQQGFNIFLAGANVDPYRRLGATRLFVIVFERDEFLLSIAPDVSSDAPLTGDSLKIYPRTDAGILSMYTDLAASDIFPFVTHCYVPGKVDFSPKLQRAAGEQTGRLRPCERPAPHPPRFGHRASGAGWRVLADVQRAGVRREPDHRAVGHLAGL